MLIVVSPAKSLDYQSKIKTRKHSQPRFAEEAKILADKLKSLKPKQLSRLMHMSDALGEQNYERYQQWQASFDLANSRQAVFAFKGDVYLGLEAEQLSAADLSYAQDHLRILSGLYGVLRPLDLMRPYRLEMGTDLKVARKKNLYHYWGSRLTDSINEDLQALAKKKEEKVLINLASHEYFNALQAKDLDAPIVTPVFKDWASGKYRVLSFFAKKARGQMVAWIIKNRIKSPQRLLEFDVEDYKYSADESSELKPTFLRKTKK
ncbi:MAG: peroxide stress protein YaaA [Gammaproteobacteria bacterium]